MRSLQITARPQVLLLQVEELRKKAEDTACALKALGAKSQELEARVRHLSASASSSEQELRSEAAEVRRDAQAQASHACVRTSNLWQQSVPISAPWHELVSRSRAAGGGTLSHATHCRKALQTLARVLSIEYPATQCIP